MAKKTVKGDSIEISPKDLARALAGISQSVLAVRKLVLQLDPSTIIRMSASIPDIPAAIYYDNPCPPPD